MMTIFLMVMTHFLLFMMPIFVDDKHFCDDIGHNFCDDSDDNFCGVSHPNWIKVLHYLHYLPRLSGIIISTERPQRKITKYFATLPELLLRNFDT